ncbi:MAG: triphosphoribosyl-dephospho-CoA synthase, partial [Bacillota bacterium]
FNDSGAHTDMNYTHFLKSITALTPYMKEFVEMGFNIEAHLESIRHIGKEAEASMYQATGNINTHKGAIFIFGAFLPFFTASIMHNRPLTEAISAMQVFIDHLTKDDFQNLTKKEALTPGEIIYQKYGIQGIRDEVKQGFKSIMNWYPNPDYTDYQKLCAIMARVDDTTIIKRHTYKTLRDVKTEMHALLNEHPFNMDYYTALSDQYKKKGISPGGSADLLSLVFFLDKTRYLLPENITE